ncbi:hypothetical protein L2755_14430 [Shewanella abyssi]|uniref:DNA primase family protein n=1 Tax=Shewanella abyssi TaxID=311789 RepID=UPI00200EA8EC|nr:DUF5906 domain-containing protein [Shewanella abyssi]MCL1050811.1 hypothetical protein [Shewanella abyssi]
MKQSSSENELGQQSGELPHLTSYNPTTPTSTSVTNCNISESKEVLCNANPTLMPPESHSIISTSDRDSKIASFIAKELKGKYAISSEESEIYRWDDSVGFWVQYGTQTRCLDNITFEELKRHLGSEGFNTAKVGSVASMLQYTLEKIPESDTRNIIFKNGTLDPSNGVFTPCSVKNIYARYSTGVDYIATDGSADFCLTFMDYLNFISGSYDPDVPSQRSADRELILKAILVMVLLRKYDWQLFVEIVGPGGTSKSTFAAMISLLVGQSSVKTIEAKDLETPERRVDILNAALLYLPDMETYQGEGAGLKKITGGDPVSCRRLYGPAFSAYIRAIVLAVNNTPMRFTDHGGAISRRRVLLLLGQVVPIGKRDPNFISKLRKEIPAIIQYLTAWIQEVGGISAVRKILTDATNGDDARDILTDSDPMTGFAKDLYYADEARCQVGGFPNSKHPASPRIYLFHAYLQYCEFYNYETRITQRTL